MYKYLVNFGFGRPTGLGFYPSEGEPVVFRWEPPGLFRELHLWDSLTITRVPMGQGITPAALLAILDRIQVGDPAVKDAGETDCLVRFTDSWVRYYPRDTELANLLGFTDSENSGVSGVEQLMDKFLRPVVGKVAYSLDSDGRPVDLGGEVQIVARDQKVLRLMKHSLVFYLSITVCWKTEAVIDRMI